jgi:hypothetical protein
MRCFIEDQDEKYAKLIINPTLKKGCKGNKPGPVIWAAKTLLIEKPCNKSSITEALIRTRYSETDELEILRRRNIEPEEFQSYNEFVEGCKDIANTLIIETKN